MAKGFASALLAAALALPGGAAAQPVNHDRPTVSHGVVVGDVTASSAVLWARGDRGGTLQVKLSGGRTDGSSPSPRMPPTTGPARSD